MEVCVSCVCVSFVLVCYCHRRRASAVPRSMGMGMLPLSSYRTRSAMLLLMDRRITIFAAVAVAPTSLWWLQLVCWGVKFQMVRVFSVLFIFFISLFSIWPPATTTATAQARNNNNMLIHWAPPCTKCAHFCRSYASVAHGPTPSTKNLNLYVFKSRKNKRRTQFLPPPPSHPQPGVVA